MYKSEEGKQAIFALYDKKLAELNIDFKYELVETSYGQTNLIVTGDAANPPLFLIPGANGCAPIGLEAYPNLVEKFQVFAVDVIGQPTKSADTKMSMKDESYGVWINEIIEKLELEAVTLVGFSLGGLIILKTLIHDESKIKEVFLASPAYIVNGNPLKAIFKIFIPMRRYMSSQNPKFIEKFLKELFTDRDEFAIQFLSKVFLHFQMDFSPVPTISKSEAQSINTPITLFGAKHDLLFPGGKMLKRAKKIFPSLKNGILIEDSKHVQNRKHNEKVEKLILGN